MDTTIYFTEFLNYPESTQQRNVKLSSQDTIYHTIAKQQKMTAHHVLLTEPTNPAPFDFSTYSATRVAHHDEAQWSTINKVSQP